MTTIISYTEEQTKELVAGYLAGKTVSELSKEFDKPERSIIAKLAKEGVYVSIKSKQVHRTMLKHEMVTKLAELLGTDEERIESLEKATGKALLMIIAAIEEHRGAVHGYYNDSSSSGAGTNE